MCVLWFHKWQQDRALTILDAWPITIWRIPIRRCSRCGKAECWLHGYGGSEIGCRGLGKGP